jgi:sugar lactone lactonase YvrE
MLDAGGQVQGKRLWREFAPEWGYPDGMTVDSEDALWIAHWEAGMVTRWHGDGQLLAKIVIPATRPTSVAFGGMDWRSLFITSARLGQAGQGGHSEGGLFVWRGAVAGLPAAVASLP